MITSNCHILFFQNCMQHQRHTGTYYLVHYFCVSKFCIIIPNDLFPHQIYLCLSIVRKFLKKIYKCVKEPKKKKCINIKSLDSA